MADAQRLARHQRPSKLMRCLYFCLCLCLCLIGCSRILSPEELFDPPRAATQTARAQTPQPTPRSAISIVESTPLPTQTPLSVVTISTPTRVTMPSIAVWFNETSADHRAAIQTISDAFEAETGIHVQAVFVDSERVLPLARSAATIKQLPDIIFHHNEYIGGLLAEDILDPSASAALVEQLGTDTFAPGVLAEMPTIDGEIAAIPSDGWQHLLLYRADWFETAELDPPDSYEAIETAAAALHKLVEAESYEELLEATEQNVSGLVVPTESNLSETQRVFEHFAAANRCELGEPEGTVALMQPTCLAALDFYYAVVNQYSPPGYQTGDSALQAYLNGRTAMIVTSPSVLPMLADASELYQPRCEECLSDPTYLAENTGFVTTISGSAETGVPATFHRLNLLGITQGADVEAAAQFAEFWFSEAYSDWLTVEPERKIPLRVTDGRTDFVEVWQALPMSGSSQTMVDIFGESTMGKITADIGTSARWGAESGENGRLVSNIYEQLTLAPRLQRMLSDFTTSSQTLVEMNDAVIDTLR